MDQQDSTAGVSTGTRSIAAQCPLQQLEEQDPEPRVQVSPRDQPQRTTGWNASWRKGSNLPWATIQRCNAAKSSTAHWRAWMGGSSHPVGSFSPMLQAPGITWRPPDCSAQQALSAQGRIAPMVLLSLAEVGSAQRLPCGYKMLNKKRITSQILSCPAHRSSPEYSPGHFVVWNVPFRPLEVQTNSLYSLLSLRHIQVQANK